MSLHRGEIPPVLEETRRIAQAAFPRGNLYRRLRDEFGAIYDDHLFGSFLCNTGCGCRFGRLPDYRSCEAMPAFEVIEGHRGSMDLAGLRVVIAGKWPKAVFEGHGQAVIFVDASAPPDHVDAAWMIFSGQAGSRLWTWYASTFEVFEGPRCVPIDMTVNGRRSHVRIPETLEVGLVPLRHRGILGRRRHGHDHHDARQPWDLGLSASGAIGGRCRRGMDQLAVNGDRTGRTVGRHRAKPQTSAPIGMQR